MTTWFLMFRNLLAVLRASEKFQIFGSAFAMRIWLNPEKLHQYGLTPAEVKAAIQAQNVQVSSGRPAVCLLLKVPSSRDDYFQLFA